MVLYRFKNFIVNGTSMPGPTLNLVVTSDLNITAVYEVVSDTFIENYHGYSIWLFAEQNTYYVKDSGNNVVAQGLASVQAARSYIDGLIPPPTHNLNVYSTPTPIQFTLNTVSVSTPYSATLNEGSYSLSLPSNIQVGGQIYNFSQWSDGVASPSRTVNLVGDVSLTALYILQPPPPPSKGHLEIHAYLDETEIVETATINGAAVSTPATVELDPGNYTVTIRGVNQSATVVSDQTIRLDFRFTSTPPQNQLTGIVPILILGSTVAYRLLGG